jgi:hypothetical protein
MNNGFWNPFLWVIAKTVGYNLLSITLEEIFYILLGGWGIYLLVKESASKETAIITGLSYTCCGYIVGHLQHFIWITGTAFFPYVLLYFVRANKYPVLKNFIFTAFAVFFFLSAAHPGFVIGSLYFFIFLIIIICCFRKTIFVSLYSPHFWKICLILFSLSGLVSFVVIRSNLDVLAHISRGSKVNSTELLLFPTTLQSYISLMFPLAVQKSTLFNTDISMRNVYIGVGSLLGLCFFLRYGNNKALATILACLLFFILLSAEGTFKQVFSKILPGIAYVRLSGEFTYFVILIFLFTGAAGLELLNKKQAENYKGSFLFVKIMLFACILVSATWIITSQSSALFNLSKINPGGKSFIKNLIDQIHSGDLLLVSIIIQLATIIFIQQYSSRKHILSIVTSLNLILFTWLALPFTGLGMNSRKVAQKTISAFPKGIYAPELVSINHTKYIDSSERDRLWLLSSYSKKIGYPTEERYPVQLVSTGRFFADSSLHQFINNQSWLFLSTDTTQNTTTNFDSSHIKILAFAPGYMKLEIKNDNYSFLVFLQNNYPYWHVKIDGAEVHHFTAYQTFIGINIPKKSSTIEILFDPKPIKNALWVSSIVIIIGLATLLIKKSRSFPLFVR